MNQRVHRITNWRAVQARHIPNNQPTAIVQENAIENPWKAEAGKWSFNPKEIGFLQPTRKRARTFTGKIQAHRSGLPKEILMKNRIVKVGIIAFIAADLFLAVIFLSSVL